MLEGRIRRADPSDTNPSGTDLSHAYAAAADLQGVDLTGANPDDARLLGADLGERTRWPAGFEPRRAPEPLALDSRSSGALRP